MSKTLDELIDGLVDEFRATTVALRAIASRLADPAPVAPPAFKVGDRVRATSHYPMPMHARGTVAVCDYTSRDDFGVYVKWDRGGLGDRCFMPLGSIELAPPTPVAPASEEEEWTGDAHIAWGRDEKVTPLNVGYEAFIAGFIAARRGARS